MVETRSGTSTDDPRIVAREADTADTHGSRRRRGSSSVGLGLLAVLGSCRPPALQFLALGLGTVAALV